MTVDTTLPHRPSIPRSGERPYAIRWALVGLACLAVVILFLVSTPRIAYISAEVLIFALYASALNLVISYSGMVSFGHAAYFGLGAYGFAMGMQKLGLSMGLALAVGPCAATIAALVFGFLSVQLTRMYASMLTLAFAELTYTIAFQWYDFTGGDNGLTGFAPVQLGMSYQAFGIFVLFVTVAGVLILWTVLNSPIGLAIRSVGDDPIRAAAMGHSRKALQLLAFVISGALSGVAGTLYSALQANVFPDYLGIQFTVDGLVMLLIGGLYTFGAGIYGAIIFIVCEELVSRYFAYWEFAMGVVMLVIVLFAQGGIAGLIDRFFGRRAN